MIVQEALLAFGLIFATFTELRASGSPVGAGEVCLVLWLLLAAGRCVGQLGAPLPSPFLQLLTFWLIIAMALCIGTMAAYVVGEVNPRSLFLHDVIAYGLVGSASLLWLLQPRSAVRLRCTAWCLVVLGSASLAVLLAEAWGLTSITGVDVWFYERLAGWSSNANQLGLLCLVLALLSLHLAETASRGHVRLAALACVALPILVGYLTLSDAFAVGLGFALVGFVGIKTYRTLGSRPRNAGLGSILALLAVLATPAMLASSAPLLYLIGMQTVKQHAHDPASERLERDIGYRTELWEQAVKKGIENGMLGLGPGPHLVRPTDLREPQWSALPNFEAHNTLMDMFLQGGLLAVATLLWLIVSTIRRVLRANLVFLPILLIAMGLFAQSHFIIRHPIIWFVIALAMAAGSPPGVKRGASASCGLAAGPSPRQRAPALT